MKSIFNTNDNLEIIERINKLSPHSKALWGKMNVSQMLVHLQIITQVTFGELKLKQSLQWVLFGTVAKKLFVNSRPFPKSLITDKSFIVVGQKEFEEEKTKLIQLIKRFPFIDTATLNQSFHPIFGTLTVNEWDTLQWKHTDHHLRQFEA